MKKTITVAALALSASTSFAIIGPPTDMQTRTYCLNTYTSMDGGMMAGSCDETANNARRHAQLNENGCADSQISLQTSKRRHEADYPIRVRACLPPNIVQL